MPEQLRCHIKHTNGLFTIWSIDWLNRQYYVFIDGEYRWYQEDQIIVVPNEVDVL